MNDVFHNTVERRIHFSTEERDITALLFADELVLLSDTRSVRGLRSKPNIVQDISCKRNLTINIEKSKVVVFKNGDAVAASQHCNFIKRRMDVQPYYRYLGVIF